MPTNIESSLRRGSERARTTAHTSALQISAQDLSGELARVLGRQLVALIVGKAPRTIIRWVEGSSAPSQDDERVLRDAYQIYFMLSPIEGDHTIRAWFMGMNPQLEDEAPAEALAKGHARDVMAAARAFVNGG